ncbi:unnamed protein product [Ixodes pacificus]
MHRSLSSRAHISSTNNASAPKRIRLDGLDVQPFGDFADDDFPDGDLTVEEFDFCLTQVATATLAQPQAGNVVSSTIHKGATGKDRQYSLEGQVKLLGRRVELLTRELHSERLSKREELKAQADLHSKELKQLKSQAELKEGELRSVVSRQTALEEKLHCRGVETRHRQVVDAGTSLTLNDADVPGSVKAWDTRPTSAVAAAQRNLPNVPTWSGHQHALCTVGSDSRTPTHIDVIRDYVREEDRSSDSAAAATLSLHCLDNAISEAAIEASAAGLCVPAEKIALGSTTHSETLIFDILAKVARNSDSRLASSSVVTLQHLAESSTAHPCVEALQKGDYISHLAGSTNVGKEIAIPLLRLVKAALETPGSLTTLCCPARARGTCLWKLLSKFFEQEPGVDLLCEGALLAQRALGCEQSCCVCFDEFAGKLVSQFERKLERSQGSVRHGRQILSCFCVVAQARAWLEQRVRRLVARRRSRVEGIEQIWSCSEEDASSATMSSE